MYVFSSANTFVRPALMFVNQGDGRGPGVAYFDGVHTINGKGREGGEGEGGLFKLRGFDSLLQHFLSHSSDYVHYLMESFSIHGI